MIASRTMFMGRARPRNYLRRTLLVAAALGVFGYLVANAIEGERGLIAAAALRRDNAAKSARVTILESERAFLEKRVRALDPKRLDLDMLKEQARRVLFFAEESEVIVQPKVPPLRR